MKGGLTRRIDEITTALDARQLKKALFLSEAKGLERHHDWIKEAAHTCLANKENKKVCDQALKDAREKVRATVTIPLDDTGLEGLEEYMTEPQLPAREKSEEKLGEIGGNSEEKVRETGTVKPPVVPAEFSAKAEKTDEELFEECEDCHVAVAAAKIADVCADYPEEAGGCEVIGRSLQDETTEPIDWIRAMTQTAEQAKGKAKEEMVGAISELTNYLERRKSPFLKALDKEEMTRCPNCGGPLDKHGCCSKCGICPLKAGGKSNA